MKKFKSALLARLRRAALLDISEERHPTEGGRRPADINLERIGFVIVILILFLNLVFFVFESRNFYLKPFETEKTEKVFNFSQFAQNSENRKFIIEDWDLFALAGYHYIKGDNPAEINFEHPPLSKYFFGLSILIFGNPNVIQIFFGLGILILIFLIGKRIFESNFLASIPPLIFSFDQVFLQQFKLSMIDLVQTFFIALSFLVFEKALRDKKFYFFLGVILGAVIATKYLGVAIFGVYFLYLLFKKRQDIKFYLGSVVIAGIFYFLSWFGFFLNGKILADFVRLNVDIIRLYRSYLPDYPFGEIWRLLATGNWRVWFGETPNIAVSEFWIFWPLSLISLVAATFLARKLDNLFLTLTVFWSWLYLISASFHVIFPRHLLLFLPFGAILLVYVVKEVVVYVGRHRR